jgi:hypothetical protein
MFILQSNLLLVTIIKSQVCRGNLIYNELRFIRFLPPFNYRKAQLCSELRNASKILIFTVACRNRLAERHAMRL